MRGSQRDLLETARQGIVLLKHDGALPLATDKPLKIAVIGAYAQLGVVSGTGSGAVVAPNGGEPAHAAGAAELDPGRQVNLDDGRRNCSTRAM